MFNNIKQSMYEVWYLKYIPISILTFIFAIPFLQSLPQYIQIIACGTSISQGLGVLLAFWSISFRKKWMIISYCIYIPLSMLFTSILWSYIHLTTSSEEGQGHVICVTLYTLCYLFTNIILQYEVCTMLIDKDKIPPITKEHIFSILGDDDDIESSESSDDTLPNENLDNNIAKEYNASSGEMHI